MLLSHLSQTWESFLALLQIFQPIWKRSGFGLVYNFPCSEEYVPSFKSIKNIFMNMSFLEETEAHIEFYSQKL